MAETLDFNKELLNKIAVNYFSEIDVMNKLNEDLESRFPLSKEDLKLDRNSFIAYAKDKFLKYNPIKSFPSNVEKDTMKKDLYVIESLFYRLCVKGYKNFDTKSRGLFLQLITTKTYFSYIELDSINNINLYLEFSKKILTFVKDNNFNLSDGDKENINSLRRVYYLSIHETRFKPNKDVFLECISLVKEDIAFSKQDTIENRLIAKYNYFYIVLDHLCAIYNQKDKYVDMKDFNYQYSEFRKVLIEYLKSDKILRHLKYKSFLVLFNIELYKVKLLLVNKKEITDNLRKRLFIQAAELIKLFYGKSSDYLLFLKKDHQKYLMSEQDALKELSSQIVIIVNEKERNVIEILFYIFRLMSNFQKYTKLCMSIYKRIFFLETVYTDRKKYIVTALLRMNLINDLEYFKREVVIIKKNIEQKPIISLVSIYNHLLTQLTQFSQNILNFYKISPLITKIHEKIFQVNNIIYSNIEQFKSEHYHAKDFQIRLEYLQNFQNEMKNVYVIASDPYFVTDIGQLYSFFIDSYIKNEGLEYREDFSSKSTMIKMEILDINPLTFAIAFLFSKIGKMKLIFTNPNPRQLGIKKKSLTNIEKQKMAEMYNYISPMLPKSDSTINWGSVERSIKLIRKKAITKNEVAPPDSRTLKVLAAFINKLTRQDVKPTSVFSTLYEESYLYSIKEWDLDPVLLFYFNAYFSKKGRMSFYMENTGEKIDISVSHINNALTYEKINSFINDLIEKTKGEDVLAQMESLSDNEIISLIGQNGEKLSISNTLIKRYINNESTLVYEKPFIEESDETYLYEILNSIFTYLGKSRLYKIFQFILAEFIENANKAALKRIHFEMRELEFDLKYSIGILNFAESLKEKLGTYKTKVYEENKNTKVKFNITQDTLQISVSNSFRIHPEEIKMIHQCVKQGLRTRDLKEAYSQQIETREGEGKGLIIVLLFLKRLGLENHNFKLNVKDDETIFKVTIPFKTLSEEKEVEVAKEIVKEIEEVPMIPENVQKLKKTLDDPESAFAEIEKLVLRDPTLSADILKIANSSFYMLQRKITTVNEGIKIIGTKAINDILVVSTCYRLLHGKLSEEKIEAIIAHSEKTAFYAKQLIQIKKISVSVDDIYLASLLHDIGKILVEGLNPEFYENIQNLMNLKDIPIDILEDIAGGVNHARIGSMMAMKWNFPDIVTEVIRCHHDPRSAKSFPDGVFLVYLANIFTHYTDKKVTYQNIDPNVLEFFEINNEEKVTELVEKIDTTYKLYHTKN